MLLIIQIKRSLFAAALGLLFIFSSQSLFAQKRPVLTEEEQVQEAVTKEVEELFKSPDFLKKKNKKFSTVKGYIVTDIAVVQNGLKTLISWSFYRIRFSTTNLHLSYLSSNDTKSDKL
jgi:uncharacterized protein YbcC (UPF0753/DUF2309 family)